MYLSNCTCVSLIPRTQRNHTRKWKPYIRKFLKRERWKRHKNSLRKLKVSSFYTKLLWNSCRGVKPATLWHPNEQQFSATYLFGSCQFRPMASSPPPSSPPHWLNLIEFAPNQIESHIEIIPRSFIHCLIRLLVARKLRLVARWLPLVGSSLVARLPCGEMTGNRWTLLLCAREQANIHRLKWFFENVQ